MSDDAADPVRDAAIQWHLRLPASGPDDWRAFIAWLESSAEHRQVYDEIAADDALLNDALEPADWEGPAFSAAPPRRRRALAWGGAGFATAAAAAAAFYFLPLAAEAQPLIFETGPGVRQTQQLADGTLVALNGDTRLLVETGGSRGATLERGEVLFTVRHDSARPFELRSGKIILRDLGTIFNVARSGEHLSVAVAEGAVLFRPEGEQKVLRAGEALTVEGDGPARPAHISAAEVGSWRQDRLMFSDTPLRIVAATLERNLGTQVSVDPELAATPFTGSLSLSDGSEKVISRLAHLAGAGWSRAGNRWTLTKRSHEPG